MDPRLDTQPAVESVLDKGRSTIDIYRFVPISYRSPGAFITHDIRPIGDDRGSIIGVEHIVQVDFPYIEGRGFVSANRYFPNGEGVEFYSEAYYFGYREEEQPGDEEDTILCGICGEGHFAPSNAIGHNVLTQVAMNQGF